ncbi:AAA family ATPase [Modestobacter sp. VKM Ac-2986]|uniref:AAA family ATPase n=1 Tax=Modestobacter sp. VKM Ac-2986 TaxID=3004140 RepID=UPI0022A9FDC6|nr:LuxR family transcriptional regulator [Modestobacter sp. VKM Ac-2986]MCZ2829093.1 AAA family ATPase [Modestobacter sp. VKM Ac-2986]
MTSQLRNRLADVPPLRTSGLVRHVLERDSRRILLTGEPGIGKSTALDAARAWFRAAGTTVLWASPSFAERHTAHSVLRDLLSELDWDALTELSAEDRTILHTATGRHQAAEDVPPLGTAIALEAVLGALAARAPVVLVIDDLQWSDPESSAGIERALRRVASPRVGLVATSREYGTRSHDAPDFTFEPSDVHVLEGLTVEELERLTRPLWPSTLTRAQVVALHEHTGGNPMWARELIGRAVLDDLGALSVGTHAAPPPLAVAVAERLRGLAPSAADVVSIVALLGRPDLSLLGEVLRFGAVPHAAIDQAEEAGFLVVTTEDVRTRHPLHASAAAARLAPARRRELHAFIARAVGDPVLRAQHLQQSAPPGPDESIAEALTLAAVVVRQRGARLRSAHFDAQAVERTAPGAPHRQERLLNQAQQLFSAGDDEACTSVLARVSADRLDARQYDAHLALSTSSIEPAAARAWLTTHAPAAAADPARRAVLSANTVAFATMSVSERARSAAAALTGLAAVDAPNAVHRALRARARTRLETGSGLDLAVVAEMDRLQGIQIVVSLDDTGLATTAHLAHQVDDVDASRRALVGLVDWAQREGKEGVERTFLAHAALVEVVGGDVPAARAFLELAGHDPTSPVLPPAVQLTAGLLLIAEGRHEVLARRVDEWRHQAGEDPDELTSSALVGASALAQGRWQHAVGHLRAAAEVADSLELVELGSRLRVDLPLAEALLRAGENDEAARRLDRVRSFLVGRDRPISQLDLHRLTSLQLAAEGDLRGSLAQATTAVELSTAAQRPADRARALVQRARVLHRLRKVALARSDLQAAGEAADEAGVVSVQEEVDAARSPSRRTRSATELTAAESRVLACLHEGQSNREIAAALFISVRTVESHVAAVLRKTGATSRAKLISRH